MTKDQISAMRKANAERQYKKLKERDMCMYSDIVAFASIFGSADDEISLQTRAQVERYCVGLAMQCQERR